jgi:hypothetical protein
LAPEILVTVRTHDTLDITAYVKLDSPLLTKLIEGLGAISEPAGVPMEVDEAGDEGAGWNVSDYL